MSRFVTLPRQHNEGVAAWNQEHFDSCMKKKIKFPSTCCCTQTTKRQNLDALSHRCLQSDFSDSAEYSSVLQSCTVH